MAAERLRAGKTADCAESEFELMSDLPREIRRHGARLQRQLRGEIEKFVVEAAGIVKRHRDRERQIAGRIDRIGR